MTPDEPEEKHKPTAEDMWQQAIELFEDYGGLAGYMQSKLCVDSAEKKKGCVGMCCADCPFDMGHKEFAAELKRRLKK